MATLGFNSAAFAPVSQAFLDGLFFLYPNLLTGPDCLLQAVRRSVLSEMIHDSVLVLLQDLILLDADGAPLPVPPGISGKATPAIFYQQRSSTPLTKTIVRVANLHGAAPAIFPEDCSLLPYGTVVPPSITIPNSFDPVVFVLTALGLDYLRSLPGNHFNPLWANTSGSVPPHPIQFIQEVSTIPTANAANLGQLHSVSMTGIVNADNSNPLFKVGSQVPNKSVAASRALFENVSFWYWWNGQNINKTIDLFGGPGNLDVLTPSAVDSIMSKVHVRFQNYPIFRPENIHLLIKGLWSKVLTQNANKSFNSLSICLFSEPNTDGSPRVFKKIDSKQTDPHLTAAISDLFEIITTCLTPNEAADIQRKAELLARVNLFMNDLSTVGNLAGALINVQVELVNTMFFNLFHIAKTEPFIHLNVPVPALNQEFFDKVTEILYHFPEAIQAVTQRALFYPEHARKRFGESVAPTPDTKKKKGKQSEASKKKAKVIAPATRKEWNPPQRGTGVVV